MGKKQRTGHISEAISPTDFILVTKVQPSNDPSAYGIDQRSKFPQNWLNTKQSWMLFHPQTSSHLLSQLFVTHLGVALLFTILGEI